VFKSYGMLGSQRGTGDSSFVECWVLKEVLVIQVLWNVGFSKRYWCFKSCGMLGSQGGTGDSSLMECRVLKEVLVIQVLWNVGFSRRCW